MQVTKLHALICHLCREPVRHGISTEVGWHWTEVRNVRGDFVSLHAEHDDCPKHQKEL